MTFSIVVKADFPARWPTLVQSLVAQMARVEKNAEDKENSPWATENVAIAIHNLTKCYKFFLNPSVVNVGYAATWCHLVPSSMRGSAEAFAHAFCRALLNYCCTTGEGTRGAHRPVQASAEPSAAALLPPAVPLPGR